MIEEGVLDGVSAAYAVHVDPTLRVGVYGLIAGPATAAADRFNIRIDGGTSGHSARPHQSADTVWIGTQIANQLYQLVGRVTDARNSAVLTVCRFKGGDAFNVIPPVVEVGGTVRCTDKGDRAFLKGRISEIAQQVATMNGASVEVSYSDGSPPVMNDVAIVKEVAGVVSELYGDDAIFHIPRPSMGAEDFAYYLDYVPGVLVRVGTSSGPETSYALHDARFDVDEACLAPASQLMACVILDHLKRKAVAEAAAVAR
jgi:amidohydrolase